MNLRFTSNQFLTSRIVYTCDAMTDFSERMFYKSDVPNYRLRQQHIRKKTRNVARVYIYIYKYMSSSKHYIDGLHAIKQQRAGQQNSFDAAMQTGPKILHCSHCEPPHVDVILIEQTARYSDMVTGSSKLCRCYFIRCFLINRTTNTLHQEGYES